MTEIRFTSDVTVRLVSSCGGDHAVVAAAKVSTSGEDALAFADPARAGANAGLINYLLRHKHGTPFEAGSLTFFVHAPAFVWWQWVRHRHQSFNLESARYKELEPVFWVPRRDRPMTPAPGFKPARPTFVETPQAVWDRQVERLCLAYEGAWGAYRAALADGVAGEVARACLPFAVYYSGWVTLNPRSLMHFLSLRTRHPAGATPSYPQAEIEEAALQCEDAFRQGWPVTWKAWNDCGRVAP
jgi:thymidylate synthase (FAD)